MKHIEHVEDVLFEGNPWLPFNILLAAYQSLPSCYVMTKYDGSPSIVFGYHPDTMKFFVATKSAFNKTGPILTFNETDLITNYGHDQSLLLKMHYCFHLLKKITTYGVWQGDLLYYPGSRKTVDAFTANTITYVAKKDSLDEKAMQKSLIGVYVHTSISFSDNTWGAMILDYVPQIYGFNESSDVHIITPQYHQVSKIKDDININTILSRFLLMDKKELLKVDKKQKKVLRQLTANFSRDYARELGVSLPIVDMIDVIIKAKTSLINLLNQNQRFDHYIDDNLSNPEGYVVVYENKPYKIINREEFTKANNKKRGRNV